MFDFDDVSTYPNDIREWVNERKKFFLNIVPVGSYEFEYEIIHKLQDVRFYDMPEFISFQTKYQDAEFTGWHNTRIEDIDTFCEQGILTIDSIDEGRERFQYLLNKIKVDEVNQNAIIGKAIYLWKRDSGSRTHCIHFFFTRVPIINDPKAFTFAENLGGEILNRALKAIDREAYRKEPYKRLWIWGVPCRVKFKAKLKEMKESTQEHFIREIIFYFVMKDIYGLEYIPYDVGTKFGAVLPNDILQIEIIKNFEEIMSQYPDFENFYE